MKNLILFVGLLLISHSLLSQEATIDDKIKRMMAASKSSQVYEVFIDNMIDAQKAADFGLHSDEYWEILRDEVKGEVYREIVKQIIPIYKRHFTEAEIDALIKFYESEVGAKLIEKMPAILDESMQLGPAISKLVSERIEKRQAEGNEAKHQLELTGCEKFREGVFEYKLPDGNMIRLERKGNRQIENRDGSENEYPIEWISDCRYILHGFLSFEDADYPDDALEVNIYEIHGDSYKYIAKMAGTDFYVEGDLITVESN